MPVDEGFQINPPLRPGDRIMLPKQPRDTYSRLADIERRLDEIECAVIAIYAESYGVAYPIPETVRGAMEPLLKRVKQLAMEIWS